ncbi:hypothetical protein B0H14DRAFT_3853704 [Mycena olivaceomarginata]|nr:hypothetical protein B0H14DRAFT_3853704 [Mycena olivaceomarginata]
MRSLLVLAASTAVCAVSLQKRSTTDPTQLSGKIFDFIIVGGGTAGLALAGRLAEWTNITVAVIEAGTDGTEYQDQITIPGTYIILIIIYISRTEWAWIDFKMIYSAGMSYIDGLTGTSYDWQYKTTPQANAGGNPLSWPRGKGLGGSSAMNGGFWCRGSSAEYDAWNTLQNGTSGAQDWGWGTMQAAIKKAENFTPMSDANAATMSVTHDDNAHGTSGRIHASYSSFQFPQLATWIPSLVSMGLPHALDPANGTNIGVSFVPSTINPSNGSRSDSNFGYIAPYAGTNLVILTGYQVTKINWNSTTAGTAIAGGVTFAANAQEEAYTVNAAKEVIISGGTIGSPQVLQLSGVGPKSLVTGLGIESVIDLPGVGANLQDHLSSSVSLTATDNNTWAALKFDQALWDQQLAIWRQNGTGMWTYWNGATAYPAMANLMGSGASDWVGGLDLNKALSSSAIAASMDSTVQAGVKAQYDILASWAASASIGQVEFIFNMFGSAAGAIGIQFCIQHAFSRGYVHITSNSVFNAPDINPNYLSVSYDADIMRAAFKYVRQIMSTAPINSVIAGETFPGSGTTADVDIDYYIAHNSGTEYHPIGTNSMMPLALGGVVNTTLVVYGTANVRVVDVSVVPLNPSAHTMATAYGIAERAADLIKATYGAAIPSNGSTSDSGSSSGSNSGSSSSNTPSHKSKLSTGTKAAIGAASGVAAIAVIAVLVLVRRRNDHRQRAPLSLSHATIGSKVSWYADPSIPIPTHAPLMSTSERHSVQPSEFSTDAYSAHPDSPRRVEYGNGQELYGFHPQPEQDAFDAPSDELHPYGVVHSSSTTKDVAPLHPPAPTHPTRYADAPMHHLPC